MYYRKYFSGTVESINLTKTITTFNNGPQIHYYVIADTVCHAIKETLEDVGISCLYDDQNSILTVDGVTVQIHAPGTAQIYYYVKGQSLSYTNQSPFSGNNYKFYVILKGDIDGILNISFGNYSAPANEGIGISIGKGVDLKDGKEIRMIQTIANAINANSFILKDDEIFVDHKTNLVFGQQITNVPQLNGNGSEITLIDCIAQVGRFKLNNCYFGHAALTNQEFYNIGGDIYYKLSNNILVICSSDTNT